MSVNFPSLGTATKPNKKRFETCPGQRELSTRFSVAKKRDERRAAFQLTYASYLRAGLIKPNPFEMRVTSFHLSSATNVFIGSQSGRHACTVSLVEDSQELGLPMEVVYGEEVASMRRGGYHLAEVSCLAFEPTSPASFWQNFIGLNAMLAQFAKHQGVDRLLIAAHPRHARFYRRFIGFEVIGEITRYPTVENHPAIACCLDFEKVDLDPPPTYRHIFAQRIAVDRLGPRPISAEDLRHFSSLVDSTESWVPLLATG